jgi:hypothetical protein
MGDAGRAFCTAIATPLHAAFAINYQNVGAYREWLD